MIEIIYKDETGECKEGERMFQIPRNIRQIGLSGGKYRVYIEDYVYTFLNRIAEKGKKENGGLAVLMGKTEWHEGITYIFIKGTVYLEESVDIEHISLEDEFWSKVHVTARKYFEELDVVGWFLTFPQMIMEVTETIGKTHLKYFCGSEKILMMMEPLEKEDAFYYYDNGKFVKTSGYYLYYEKNLNMQEYITDIKWWENSETEKIISDEAVKRFRKKILKAPEIDEEKGEKSSLFSYAATACLVVAIMATGANFIRNYQQIQMEEQELEASAVLTVNDQFEISKAPQEEISEESAAKSEEIADSSADGNAVEKFEKASVVKEETVEEMTEKNSESEESLQEISKETSGESVFETYMIRPGDTLYQISILNYGDMEAIEEICRLNNISEEEQIYPGQIIVLP